MSANMKEVKLRIKSVQNTMQITRAMELVAASKLRRAQEQVHTCHPYFKELYETLREIAAGNTDLTSAYVKEGRNPKACYVLIAGDRGLAGGYHINLFKHLEKAWAQQESVVLPIGKKAAEYCMRQKVPCLTEEFVQLSGISAADCSRIASLLCCGFLKENFGHLYLCYTKFISALEQRPEILSVLPLSQLVKDRKKEPVRKLILYEPNASEVFKAVVPEYAAGLIYGGVCHSMASEQAARRSAMEAAARNGREILEQLQLFYNRVRQAGITQEISEIMGGAEGGR